MKGDDAMQEGGKLTDLIRQILAENEESARAYLRESWLSKAMGELRQVRRSAELTQEEVARRLSTTQSSIARWENDEDGRISLHSYIDYLIACGVSPYDIETRPVAEMREYAHAFPGVARYAVPYTEWCVENRFGVGQDRTAEDIYRSLPAGNSSGNDMYAGAPYPRQANNRQKIEYGSVPDRNCDDDDPTSRNQVSLEDKLAA